MKTLPLDSFCQTGSGGTPNRSKKSEYYDNGTIPWVKSGELARPVVDSAKEFITESGLNGSSAKYLKPGAILIAMYGATVGQVSRLGIAAATNQAICHIYPDKEVCDSDYLYRVLKGAKEHLLAQRVGGGQPNISQTIIRKLSIPLPPLDEQKRIAGILDAADALRAKRRESLVQLDVLLQSTFLNMFGDPVTNPMGWEEREVENICRLVRGSSPRPKGDSQFYGGPVPRLMVGDITRDGFWVTPRIDSLTEAGASKSRPVPAGTVVMAVSGDVGVMATVQVPCCVHDGFVAFLDLDETAFDSRFFMFQFHFLKMTHEQRKAGAIFQNLTTKDIKAMRLPTPALELQRRFASTVDAVGKHKILLGAHLAELDTLFASLQSRAFRGDL